MMQAMLHGVQKGSRTCTNRGACPRSVARGHTRNPAGTTRAGKLFDFAMAANKFAAFMMVAWTTEDLALSNKKKEACSSNLHLSRILCLDLRPRSSASTTTTTGGVWYVPNVPIEGPSAFWLAKCYAPCQYCQFAAKVRCATVYNVISCISCLSC